MGILSRYIVLEILKLLFPIWLSIGFLLFILEWLAQVFKIHADAFTVLILYAYKIPSHLQLTFPIAVLLSVLIVLGGMNRNRELVAAQSVGVQKWKILAACLMALFFSSMAYAFVVNNLAPWGMRKHYETVDAKVNKVPSRFLQIRQEKIWYRNKDVLYKVRYFEPQKNELYDVTIYTFDEDFHIAQTIFAAKAAWDGQGWILSDGITNITDKRLSTPVAEKFKTKKTKLIEAPKTLKRIDFNAETMTQKELSRAIDRHRALGINTAQWEVVFHSRLSFFLIAFVFLLLAFGMSTRFSRTGGVAKDTVFVVTVSMLYWLVFSFGVNLGNNGKLNPIASAWAPSILFLLIVSAYLKSRTFKSQSD